MTQPPNPGRPAMTEAERKAMVRLADACEKATGPDRELDAAICVALGIEPQAREMLQFPAYDRCVRYFTASLDAAMMLIPDNADAAGEHFRLEAYNSPGVLPAHVRASAWIAGAARVFAATPTLALTAAALRARANQGTPA